MDTLEHLEFLHGADHLYQLRVVGIARFTLKAKNCCSQVLELLLSGLIVCSPYHLQH